MASWKALIGLLIAVSLTGCSVLRPKPVELFQQKVEKVPEYTPRAVEIQRQAATLAAVRARDTLVAATAAEAPESVLVPAKDTVILTDAVAGSLGAPSTPPPTNAQVLAERLLVATGELQKQLDQYRKEVQEVAGKRIEGTGLVQIPYFVWVFLVGFGLVFVVAVGFVGWVFVRAAAASNPLARAAVSAAGLTAELAQKGFVQVVRGGERFKQALTKTVTDQTLQQKILELFRQEQQKAQDADVQHVIKEIT